MVPTGNARTLTEQHEAKQHDAAEKERGEIAILLQFVPPQLSDDELIAEVRA